VTRRRGSSALAVSGSHFSDCPGSPDECTCKGQEFKVGEHRVVCDDARNVELPYAGILFYDPPYDDVPTISYPGADWILAFSSPGRAGDTVIDRFGSPSWIFTWDTMSPWSLGPRRPLNQSRLCFLYGDLDRYDRELGLWGPKPPARTNPQCTYEPLDGRRLTDVYSEAPRHMAGRVHPHQKPQDWITALVGCCVTAGPLVDPFAGSGTAAVAAQAHGMASLSIEREPDYVSAILERLAPSPPQAPTGQVELFAS
jgi:hypothetical protein